MTAPARWQDTVDLVVEVGYDGTRHPGSTWGKATWGQAKWSGLGPSWTPLDCADVLRFISAPNQEQITDSFAPAEAVVELVDTNGAWTSNPHPGLRCGLPVRVAMIPRVAGIGARVLAYGWLEAIEAVRSYDIATVTLRLLDALAQVAPWYNPIAGAAVGAGERTDQRFHRILDQADWPASLRRADVGTRLLGATTGQGKAATMLDEVAYCEPGVVHSDVEGRICFTVPNRGARPPVARLGPSGVCPATFTMRRSSADAINDQSVGGAYANDPQRVVDLASVATIGWRTGPERLTLPLADAASSRQVAAAHLRPVPYLTVVAAELDPEAIPDAWPLIATLAVGDRIECDLDPGIADAVVIGLTHDVDGIGWLTTVWLWQYRPAQLPGRWGIARWGVDTWSA